MINKTKQSLFIRFFVSLLVCFIFFAPQSVNAQSYVETFGQNRIQHRKFDWKYFDTKHFRVYHYDKAGRQLGRYVAEEAENNISVIEKKMGGQFPTRFNIVLYNSYDDVLQTNIGLTDQSQISAVTISGTWNLVGDKLVVYHTGKHTDLRRQIQSGMARVVMQRMIFGESFKKMAKTALLINLPQWVTDGFISYLVDGWNAEANSEWKRLLDAKPKTGFHELSELYPEMAGKAFWKFVADNYGNEKMKNLLGDMQQRTSLNKSMKDKANLGIKVTKAYDSCMVYYRKCYSLDSGHQELPDSAKGLISLKVPKWTNTIIRDIRVSPRGTEISYTAWHDGEYAIYLQKTSKDQTQTTLLEGGSKDLSQGIDPNYPLMAWSNGGNKLAILYKNKKANKTYLRIYNSQKNRIENYVIPPNRFDRVLGMCFMQDDDKLVFSAIKKSQTDLYTFTIKGSKMANITDDAWDDIEPVFVSGGSRKGILFLSNRPKPNMNVPVGVNELPTGPMNVYFYNTTTQRTELLQCSNITSGHIAQPIQYGTDNFAYLYDGNGITNKYVVMFGRDKNNRDTAYSLPITNYNTSIISHQYNLAVDEVADVIQVKNKYMVYFHKLEMPTDSTPAKHLLPTTLSIEKQEAPQSLASGLNVKYDMNNHVIPEPSEPSTLPDIKGGTAFQSEFTDTTVAKPKKRKRFFNSSPEAKENNAEADSSTLAVITDSAYVKMKPSPYKVSFKPDMFNVRIDNSILFTQYQPYASNGGQYQAPGISALTTINMNELLENHKITAGFQIPVDLASTAYFLQYSNTKHRLDWSILGLRTQKRQNEYVVYSDTFGNPLFAKLQLFKNVTNIIQGSISYPFSKTRSFRFSTAVRQDRLIQKAQDTLSLSYELPNSDLYWSLSRAEYVFDNTTSPILNIRKGTRAKIYSEYMYQVNGTKQSCYNIGIDYRTYRTIYKNAIWATRVAYAHSDGTAQVQYQLGGVDNWVGSQAANNNPDGGNYGFIALATSLRGYKQGARKGNNFGVVSTEARLPVLTTFIKRPIQSAVLKNLQIVAFCDAGSAWKGFLPSADNLTSTYSYPRIGSQPGVGNVQVILTVPNDNGLAIGYGGGLRTTLFGYFVRLDAAWNIEPIKKPIIYFAIGTDF
jgi:hypothetical protein